MKRIAFVVSNPTTADAFLRGHIAALSEHYKVDLIANLPEGSESSVLVKNQIYAPIHRKINLWRDLIGLVALIRIFSGNRYDAVHSVTPKAGLLGMLAAWITRVPVRHHTFTGQVWATRSGYSRWLLKTFDKLIHLCSTHSLVDSFSQRDFLLAEKVVRQEKSSVLASGSISGVDIERFNPDLQKRQQIREQHAISESEFVFLFLGRINNEKGLPELISAFRKVSKSHPEAKLMVVGSDESGMFEDGAMEKSFSGKLLRVGYTREPEAYFNAADVFCLPSHREGFGSVLIEAAACGVTSVASNIYGISDAVVDGQTGLLHVPKSAADLESKMELVISNPDLRQVLAQAALKRAREEFSSSVVENEFVEFYGQAFESRGR
ncbi:glycosyltransferase family 4 protein [Marinobacter pelagius]|uniref:glycosyltransferase family 4 protein n=1 Tax=Marinobacter sp. C7 TaxID=2951363 RepID=UPI001EEFD2E9|nr:glycosyltransferase family 4 protein [Marinobacter sp. C7]MCG7199124.1 glycosyltransferase family 4 protein [Marinobacter sp. C7]